MTTDVAPAAGPLVPEAGGGAVDAPPLRLLVVDDDAVDRLAVRRGLARAGVAAVLDEADGAPAALERLAAAPYDCVLLDYQLPGADGLSLLQRMRAQRIDAPVIMLTGHGDEQTAVTVMKAGAIDYLPKAALTPERLAHSLRYAVMLDRAARATRRAQRELREHAERQRFLAEASRVLSASLDPVETMRAVARLCTAVLSDYCVIYLMDGEGTVARVAAAHADAAHEPRMREIERLYVPDPGNPASKVMESHRLRAPVRLDAITSEWLAAIAPSPDVLALFRELEPRTGLVVPLIARDTTVGVAVFVRTGGAAVPYADTDEALALDLAQRAAVAIDNARLFEAAERARAAADEANRAKAQFLAMMSHDLRTPLNAIGGYAQLVQLGVHGPVTEAQRGAMERVRRAQEHLLRLINDILNFARLEAGQLALEVTAVPVHELLLGLRSLVEPQLEARRISYRYEPGPADVRVRADRERMLQVLLNLLTNAVKFTDPGGEVTVRWDARPAVVAIHVRDTGRGIPADKLPRIFEPFVQVDARPVEHREGVGLGLAISRELAHAMGGELSAESSPAEGSTFTLTLPRA